MGSAVLAGSLAKAVAFIGSGCTASAGFAAAFKSTTGTAGRAGRVGMTGAAAATTVGAGCSATGATAGCGWTLTCAGAGEAGGATGAAGGAIDGATCTSIGIGARDAVCTGAVRYGMVRTRSGRIGSLAFAAWVSTLAVDAVSAFAAIATATIGVLVNATGGGLSRCSAASAINGAVRCSAASLM